MLKFRIERQLPGSAMVRRESFCDATAIMRFAATARLSDSIPPKSLPSLPFMKLHS
jgi:hypothetical protein